MDPGVFIWLVCIYQIISKHFFCNVLFFLLSSVWVGHEFPLSMKYGAWHSCDAIALEAEARDMSSSFFKVLDQPVSKELNEFLFCGK